MKASWRSRRFFRTHVRDCDAGVVENHKGEAPYGKPVDAEDVRRAGKGKKIKIVGFAHGETSTGVITGIDAYRKVADELGALLIVDTVASLAAVPVDVDKQRIDILLQRIAKGHQRAAGNVADYS